MSSNDSSSDIKTEKITPVENGGPTQNNNRWTQTISEVNVYVTVPEGTKGKQVDCKITKTHLRVGLKGKDPSIDGDFHAPVIVDDCFWNIEDGKEIVIYLQKKNDKEWWPKLVEGDPEIDTQKVDVPSQHITDLDQETRMTVERMMYDQRQKQMGLPTSEDRKREELVEKFKAANPQMKGEELDSIASAIKNANFNGQLPDV